MGGAGPKFNVYTRRLRRVLRGALQNSEGKNKTTRALTLTLTLTLYPNQVPGLIHTHELVRRLVRLYKYFYINDHVKCQTT